MIDEAGKPQKPETDEVATLGRDQGIFQGFLNVLENPDKVLRLEAGGDITVYDDIGRDPLIGSNLRTRAQAVVGKEWDMAPATDDNRDVEIAEYAKKVFLGFPFDLSRRAILRGGVLKGYAVSEIMWDYSEGDISIRAMKHRAQRRFRFDLKEHLRLLTAEDGLDGIDLTEAHPRKFQTFTFGDEPETSYGVGLGRELYWPWWFKKNGIKFWLMFCERFGSPTGLGKYPRGASPGEKATLLNALDTIRSSSSVIIPEGMEIALLEAAKSGSASTQSELVRYMDEQISICILGQTATTQGTPGRLGNDNAQEQVRDDLVKADADALTESLNAQVVRWLVDYQFPGHGRYPQMWIRAGAEADLNKLAERDKSLREGGVLFKKSYYVGSYGLKSDEFEVEETTAGPETKPASFAEQAAQAHPADLISDRLDREAQPAIDAWIEQIEAMLAQAESLEQFKELLLAAYGDLPAGDLAAILASGLTAAEAAGRFDLEEQSRG